MYKPIRYAAYLEAEAQEITAAHSGKKTRLRLMAAMARLLEKESYNSIKVMDICKKAGTAKGTFFIYFKTKEEFDVEIMHGYMEFEHRTMPIFGDEMGSWDTTRAIVEWYEQTFSVNHGLINCMIQLSSVDKDCYKLWETRNQRLIDRWIPLVEKEFKPGSVPRNLLDLALHSIGSIMDQSLYARYGIGAFHGENDHDAEMLMELHSLLMYRAIYGREPETADIKYVGALLNKND